MKKPSSLWPLVFAVACGSSDDTDDTTTTTDGTQTGGITSTAGTDTGTADTGTTAATAATEDTGTTAATAGTDTDATGTTGDDGSIPGQVPTLVSGSFSDATTLRLTFTEPLSSAAGLDPANFRLGVTGIASYMGYDYTCYYDIDYWKGNNSITGVMVDMDMPEVLILTLTQDIDAEICTTHIAATGMAQAGIRVHYWAMDTPILDLDGEALADFGASWVYSSDTNVACDVYGTYFDGWGGIVPPVIDCP